MHGGHQIAKNILAHIVHHAHVAIEPIEKVERAKEIVILAIFEYVIEAEQR